MAAHQNDCLAGMVIYGSDAVALCWLTWCRNHDLSALRAPRRLQSRVPTEVELIGIIEDLPIEDLPRLQMVALGLDRLFLGRVQPAPQKRWA
jgi:hypothetical protein